MKIWTTVALGCLAFVAPSRFNDAMAATHACASIHAVQIATEEGLGDCDTTVMTALVGKASGGPLANLADAAWHADCLGLTANGCATLHYLQPERTVQGNGGDMTAIFPDTGERCTDGTRPAYYYSPGSGSGANKWIVYLNGNSGRCTSRIDRATGAVIPLGEACYGRFIAGDADSAFLLKAAKNQDGILSANPINPFYNWNRVHVPSCSNDQYQGQRVHHDIVVKTAGADTYTADVFSRGHAIVKNVLLDLAVHHNLADSESLVLHGASGGASGLVITLDDLAAYARLLLLSNPDAPIVGLIDSRGAEPGIDNSEARFDDAAITCRSIFEADCAGLGFDSPPQGTDLVGFDFDPSAYLPHSAGHPTWGGVYEKFLSWNSPLDAECQSVHGANAPECLDTNHVLFNHLRTPVFIAASISDSNQWNNPIEFLGQNQPDTSWQTLDCGVAGQRYIEHARNQLASYVRNRDNAAGGADGESHGSGLIGVWAPQIWDHVLAHDRCKFNSLTVGGVTLSAAFSNWLAGGEVKLVDGIRGATTGTECGTPVPACPGP